MINNDKKLTLPWMAAFLMGMTGELYLTFPALGILPMFDVFSYCVSLFILMMHWNKMGKTMRRYVIWGFAWTAAAAFACFCNGIAMHDALKRTAIVSSSWALLIVAWYVLRRNPKLYLFYLIGASIGSYIGIYYFKQGVWQAMEYQHEGQDIAELLIDKQRFPIYANLICYGGVLTLMLILKRLPVVLISAGCMFLLMNGGARSNFGFYVVAATSAIVVNYNREGVRRLFANKFMLIMTVLVGIFVIFTSYKIMAKSGFLGQGQKDKYEIEFERAASGKRGLAGRGNYGECFSELIEKPWGHGPFYGKHSVLTTSASCDGVIGLLFWLNFIWQVIWFISARFVYTARYAPFLMLIMSSACWAAVGSPFGARHTYFVMMALIALSRDNPLYGASGFFKFTPRYINRHMGNFNYGQTLVGYYR